MLVLLADLKQGRVWCLYVEYWFQLHIRFCMWLRTSSEQWDVSSHTVLVHGCGADGSLGLAGTGGDGSNVLIKKKTNICFVLQERWSIFYLSQIVILQ